MAIGDWLDRDYIQQFCRHSSAFVAGLVFTAVGKPALWLLQWISTACGEPIHASVIFILSWVDDLLLLFFVLSLAYRFVIEAIERSRRGGRGSLMFLFTIFGTVINHG